MASNPILVASVMFCSITTIIGLVIITTTQGSPWLGWEARKNPGRSAAPVFITLVTITPLGHTLIHFNVQAGWHTTSLPSLQQQTHTTRTMYIYAQNTLDMHQILDAAFNNILLVLYKVLKPLTWHRIWSQAVSLIPTSSFFLRLSVNSRFFHLFLVRMRIMLSGCHTLLLV